MNLIWPKVVVASSPTFGLDLRGVSPHSCRVVATLGQCQVYVLSKESGGGRAKKGAHLLGLYNCFCL